MSSLFSRRDVIVVASVSCIYGIGSKDDYEAMLIHLRVGEGFSREQLLEKLVALQYDRNDIAFERGQFPACGATWSSCVRPTPRTRCGLNFLATPSSASRDSIRSPDTGSRSWRR
jgi:excinuclease UvrABC helicase subunit UvrB